VKTNVDSVFKAIQRAAIVAYSREEELAVMSVYQNRRDIIVKGLQSLGWPIEPLATLYVWAPVPVIRRLNLSHCSRQVVLLFLVMAMVKRGPELSPR